MTRIVSIIIGNYNYEKYVGRAIESALNQVAQKVEVIVVDDGSTDNSLEVIQAFGERIKVIVQPNAGQAAAFNAGFMVSSGDPVIFLDADDVLLPGAANTAIRLAEECDTWSKLCWRMPKIGPSGEQLDGYEPASLPASGDLLVKLLEHGPLGYTCTPTSGNAWRRQFLQKVMPIPEGDFRRGADGYLLLLSPLYGRSHVIETPFSCYRVHGGNFLASQSEFAKMATLKKRYTAYRSALTSRLDLHGVDYDPTNWRHEHWETLEQLHKQVCSNVPESKTIILIDQDILNVGNDFFGRPRLHLIDRDGMYDGPPSDDGHAIEELKRLRALGARYVVFTWYCDWWQSHYTGMMQWLLCNARLLSYTKVCRIYAFS